MRLAAAGIGPGEFSQMTHAVTERLAAAEVIVGYTKYVEQIRPHFPDKTYLTTGMRDEERRCEMAVEKALAGFDTVLICGGDPGVYALAGLLIETAERMCEQEHGAGEKERPEVDVLPGVTAASAGAALLGAPLVHDFAAISLSTALTDWPVIAKRLAAAAEADFCIVLYNPRSRLRPETLARAAEILMAHLPGDRVCGIAEDIAREGQRCRICALSELAGCACGMAATVFVGNSRTRRIGARLVTPRGYAAERAMRVPAASSPAESAGE